MGLFDFFKPKKTELNDQDQKWNKMWDLWVDGEADSPYAELMTYQSEINNGGPDQYFTNVENTSDLQKEFITPIKVGNWVTQYSAGYWKVIAIFPKYAEEDYCFGGKSWKKGDHISEWLILKKGFTPKMKPYNECRVVDAMVCQPVSDDVALAIETAFAENPKAKQKFDNAPDMPSPSICNTWMVLSDAQAESFSKHISNLPERFTEKQFWEWSAEYRQYVENSSRATHIFRMYSYLWEISDDFEPMNFGPELEKL